MHDEKSPLHIKQKHFLFGTRELSINDDNQLFIREKSLLRSAETSIPLEQLQPHPTFAKSFSLVWLVATLLAFAFGVTAVFLTQHLLPTLMTVIAVVCFLITLIFAYRFALYTTDLVVFRHIRTNEYLLYLWRDKPNAARFSFFLEELNQRLQRITRQVR